MKRKVFVRMLGAMLAGIMFMTAIPVPTGAEEAGQYDQTQLETVKMTQSEPAEEMPAVTISAGEIVWDSPAQEEAAENRSDSAEEIQTDEERIQQNIAYKENITGTDDIEADNSSRTSISNKWLEAVVSSSGKFTIGTVEGNENYVTDNNQKLLFGHPDPSTSETLLNVDGLTCIFNADDVYTDEENNYIYATMTYEGVLFTQILSFMKNGSSDRLDTVKISYEAVNQSTEPKNVGIRIMMDTMIADNDRAPFKVAGIGNVTNQREFRQSEMPSAYQVYDDLDEPTTMANGTVYLPGQRKPDLLQFTNWPHIEGDENWYCPIDEEDGLGDSAVAIYYDPIQLSSGDSTSVATYYGTGLGITDSEDSGVVDTGKLASSDFGIYLLDSRTMAPIQSATVVLQCEDKSYEEQVTDGNGKAVFKNVSEINHKQATLTINHADYTNSENKTKTVIVNCGNYESVYLKSADDPSPEIVEAKLTSSVDKYNNKDLLKGVIYINSNPTDIQVTDENSETLTLTIKSDATEAVYQLIVDGEIKETNDTGIFELKAIKKDAKGKNYSTLRLDGYSEGKKIYARVVSREGVDSASKILGIKISMPSTTTTNMLQDFKMTNELQLGLGSGDSDALNKILQLYFGDSKVKASPLLSKVKISVDEDGKVKVAIKGSPDQLKLETPDDWKTFRSDYEMALRTARRNKRAYTDGTKAGKFGYNNLEGKVYFCGYGEGSIQDATDGDGKLTVNVGVIVGFSGEASHTHQFFLGYVPVYITGGLKLDGQVNAEAALTLGNSFGARFSKGEMSLTPELYLEGGVGASGVLSLGVKGDGKVLHKHDFVDDYSKVDLTAEASLEVHLLLYSNSLVIGSKTWNLYDSNDLDEDTLADNKGTEAEEKEDTPGEIYDLSEFKVVDRSYLASKAEADEAVDADQLAQGNTVNSNVYSDAQPKLVQTEDGILYRFWLSDNEDRDIYNRTQLVYSYSADKGESWTKPAAVDANETADFGFDVDTVQNQVYVIWQNATKTFTEEELKDAKSGVATVVSNSVASIATVEKDEVTRMTSGVNDKTGVLQPKITAADKNHIYTAWYNNVNHTFVADGTEEAVIGETSVYMTAYENGTWGQTEKTTVGEHVITSLDLGYLNQVPTTAYVLDTDDNLNTSADRELYLVSGVDKKVIVTKESNNAQLDESPVFARINGVDTLFWYENGNVYRTASDYAAKTPVMQEEYASALSNSAFAVLDGDKPMLAWFGRVSYDTETPAIYLTDIEKDSIPYVWASLNDKDAMLTNLSGVVTDGKQVVSFAEKTYKENATGEIASSDLCVYREMQENPKLYVANVVCDENELVAGSSTGKMTITLENQGNIRIDTVDIKMGDAVTTETGLALAPGETKEYLFENINIPEVEEPALLSLHVSIADAEGTAQDDQADEDEMQIGVGYADVRVEQQENLILGNREYLVFEIANLGTADAEGVNLKLMDTETMDGTVFYDNSIGELKAKESCNVFCPVDSIPTDVVYERLVTQTEEINKDNNTGLVCIHTVKPELLRTSAFEIGTENEEAGTIEGNYADSYETNQEVAIKAVVKDGFAFNGWTLEGDGTIEDDESPETRFIMGNSDVKLRANFVTENPMTGITLPDDFTLEKGTKYKLQATATPTDASGFLDYESSDPEIVSVGKKGVLTAQKEGTAIITVNSRDNATVKSTVKVTVTGVKVTKLRMTYPSRTLTGNGTTEKVQVIKTPYYATEKLKWSSSNEKYVKVDENGNMTAVANGTAIIRCENTDGTISAESTVTVINPLNGLQASKQNMKLVKGTTETVSVLPIPSYTSESLQDLTWTSLNTNIATVTPDEEDSTKAVITAVCGGTTRVIAKKGDYSVSFTVSVLSPATAVYLSNSTLSITEDRYAELSCSLEPSDATDDVSWSSSNQQVATVDSDGYVYGESEGTAIITATADSGASASCIVTVKSTTIQATTIDQMQSSHPYENNMSQKWVYTRPGAESLTLVFAPECELEEDFDFLYIYNKAGKQVGKYTGTELQNKTITIVGDTVTIKMTTDSSGTYYGFALTNIVASVPASAQPQITRPTVAQDQTVSTVTLNAKKTVLQVKKKTSALKATVSKGDKVKDWTSSNKKVATVSKKGVIKAKKVGKTVITVTTVKGAKATCVLIVQKKAVKLKKLSVGKKAISMKKGKSYRIQAVKNPITYDKKVTYKTSNKKIATVDKKGVIKARKKGRCVITVKCGSKKQKIKVTVK